ncbi:archaeal heat shock protein Hsp14 [Ferroplasma acidiphilum]|jgi:HSP20 family molecular chaperone IbpA|uniref:Hsp 20 family small heat shock protein n=1 Tax=Ferroplasma acidiphilum TaxID=74969 RepID=A0A1V0N2A5_9ARCH|nr:archaeal heat shock protein Hsp14 [Ferroplasma acidiphilum]ARD84221.1 hsp 20 family small heat shock protein [Ferroplasma acidiphilum]MCL4349339.1 Hsp20/alpha crystallin family protein [Candidatus Thermoplasmatota archaeon]NOL60053.1 Hsp20/alpha crystallin family protein [Ferroplasma acidiphilum]WMT53128.1 MAG: archaeal heat shock protein Hsp14 [Ferroplasma acidiphilum]
MYRPLKYYSDEFMKNINNRAKEIMTFMYPPVTMYEDNGYIGIEADLPGFSREDIKVTLEKNAIVIRAEREIKPEGTVFENQRPEKVFKRMSLPMEVDTEQEFSAKYNDGVLSLKIPVKNVKTVKIE